MLSVNTMGVATAFMAGMASFLSPCVLPVVPGYLSHSAGYFIDKPGGSFRRRILVAAGNIPFVAGFSTVFVLIGLGISVFRRFTAIDPVIMNYVAGGIVMVFGLLMTGLIHIPWLNRDLRFHPTADPNKRILGGYVLGVGFALGWTPCIGPILGSIMTLAAAGTMGNATTLMLVYALGLAVPFLLASATLDFLLVRMNRVAHMGAWIQRIAGGLLILTGIAIATGQMTSVSSWLVVQFPLLSKLG
ncbi:MAG: cytochrome c biogenesis protein CcdA [Rhodanobacter sp.]|nr:MAG: cytochrome c biogenesis protein CcdA [Rhodanobacter sp.]